MDVRVLIKSRFYHLVIMLLRCFQASVHIISMATAEVAE